MVKLLKIIGKIIGISFEWVLIFVILFSFIIRTSIVQTYLAKIATSYLSKELKTEIKIDKISVIFINRIALDGLLIKDLQNDTLAYISTAYITLDELNNKHKLIIKKAEIENSVIKLRQDKITRDFNYEFIEDYFKTSDTTKPLIIQLNEVHLKNVDFHFDDYLHPKIKWGMDYDHLKVDIVNLDLTNISINSGIIRANINNLRANEKSGFVLDKLNCIAKVSEKGVYTKNVRVQTPYSIIYAPKFNMVMNHYSDYMTFIDSVSFDAYAVPSKISMKDIAFFVPKFEGMDQIVYAKGNVSRKTKNMRISNLDLTTGDHSKIRGNFNLPDFRDLSNAFYNEKIDYAFFTVEDLKKIKLPKSSSLEYLEFDKQIERLGYFETINGHIEGFNDQFVLSAKKINTKLGKFEMSNGILFTENKTNNSYYFERSQSSDFDIKVDSFQLGEFIQNSDLGIVDGTFFLSGEAKSFSDIKFNDIECIINQFDYLGYSYKNITIEKGKYINNVFDSKIDIKDENLCLSYDGIIDFNGNQHILINVDITKANLDKLEITHSGNSVLKSSFSIDLKGNHANNIAGKIIVNNLDYAENERDFNIPKLDIVIDRKPKEDYLSIKSKLGNVLFVGKVDFNTIIYDFENQVSKLFPAIIPLKKPSKRKLLKTKNNFIYSIETNEINDLLTVLLPSLKLAPGTKIEGHYNGLNENALMVINSKSIKYNQLKFEGVSAKQEMNSNSLTANYFISNFYLNDSIDVKNLSLIINGDKDLIKSKIAWNPDTKNESAIEWNTSVLGIDKYDIALLPSYFSLKEKKWSLVNKSDIVINGTTIDIGHFLLERDQQYLSVNGRISKNSNDQLNFRINDFNLDDFSSLFGPKINIKGLVNGWGYISNPYDNLSYSGDANIQNLYINDKEIGSIFIQSQWNKSLNSIGINGDLIYKGNETFGFEGQYNILNNGNNLDFNLIFDNTDISFVNAFIDPEIITNVKGFLVGKLKVIGTFENPEINGEIELINGNAKLELLNVNYTLNGKINSDKYGFYINNLPITDQEGNTGSIIGSIYHTKFSNWNYDVVFNLEDDGNRNGFAPGHIQPLDRFLVMNTSYKKEDVYYGKGYGTGIVEISGFSDIVIIDVNLKTEDGSKIFFPMYGIGDIEEDESFVKFKQKNNPFPIVEDSKFDFTGLELRMNFKVTPEAEIKIILNEETGDEITASGSGDISVNLNELNDLTLDGAFQVKQGDYNFVMRPINQKFIIQENSTVTWTGDPYKAIVDLKCYYTVYANLNEISPVQNTGSSSGTGITGNQEIKCYLNLTESILKPTISFDIQAPKTNETGLSLLNRIKSNPDMLNKQFFSLLLFKNFQPIDGQTNTGVGGSSAALDLAQSQINSMLSQVSKDYKLNVGLDKNVMTSGTSMTVGVSKGFFGDRLLLRGNFGVENTGVSVNSNKNFPIGDVNLEYILNEAGTFKVNIFNESNQNRIYSNNPALFSQGAGIQYQEEFNTVNNFKVYQYFLDLFRSKKNKKSVSKRKTKRVPVTPINSTNTTFFIPTNYLENSLSRALINFAS